jgi:NDP-sugar pyrophosphorylase family protein
MYLVEPSILDLIPDDKFFDMTDLIKEIREKGLKIGVYPVSEKSWVDVGRWEEYEKALNSFKL